MYDQYARLVLIGGPKCGKTTFASMLNRPVLHTNDMILENPFVSGEAIARWLDQPAPWVIEGVTATLALRSWLKAHTQFGNDGCPPCTSAPVLCPDAVAPNPASDRRAEAQCTTCCSLTGEASTKSCCVVVCAT